MEEWKECKLGDFFELHRGYDLTKSEIKTGPYPVVCSTSIMGYHSEYKVRAPGVVIGRSGTLGEVQFIDKDFWPHNTSLYVSDFKGNSPKFIKYFLQLFGTGNVGGGSAVPTLNRNHLQALAVKVPPLPTQQKIAAILSSLDDKIELNNKINTNLEQQAGALFKNWFVDFEPFGGKMPEGWKVGKLSEILRLKKNPIQPGEDTSLPYLPIDLIHIKSLAIRGVRPNEEALSSLLRFEENDILIGAMRVYFHRVAIAPFDGITRTTCFVLEPFNPKYFAYAAITCNQDLAIDYAQKTSKGSTMPYAVWEGGLGDFEIPIPDEVTAEKFNNIVEPFLEQIKKSYFENKNLQELRESLLPKLMNREIEV